MVKTVKDIEMLLQDEVVAARRLQAVINSDILNFVTDHIRNNNPQTSTSFDFYGNSSLASRIKRKEYDSEYKEIPGTVPCRPILQCILNQLPLRFVNYKDNYEDAINKFRSLLTMQNKFGTDESGFSSPYDLFNHKDQKYDLRNYQFDLKTDDQYFYVILREIRTASEEGSPRDNEDDFVNSSTDQSDCESQQIRRAGVLRPDSPTICRSMPTILSEGSEIEISQERKFQPIEAPSNDLADGLDREVERIMDKPLKTDFRRTRGSVVSTKSVDARRESSYRFDEEDSVKPDFWLILEIESLVRLFYLFSVLSLYSPLIR